MFRVVLAGVGLGAVLASPVLTAGDSRYALIVESPWEQGEAIEVGRGAGGLLVRSGWYGAVFFFPEGVDMPAWTGATATLPVKGEAMACSRDRNTERS